MKKFIEVKEEVFGMYEHFTKEELIAKIDRYLERVVEDQRGDATFYLDSKSIPYSGGDFTAFYICYKRLETDKEEKKREAFEAKQQKDTAKLKEYREKNERKEYERLKKKFEKDMLL